MPAPYEKHRAQLKAILLAWGMPEDNAEATADILSWADLHGVDSHGISMIPGYDRLRRAGRALPFPFGNLNRSERLRVVIHPRCRQILEGPAAASGDP
jgi:LDH2 family malate/lactate/ureidoglycolate dehydrogenase